MTKPLFSSETRPLSELLPSSWTARSPRPADVEQLIGLLRAHRLEQTGSGSLDPEAVRSEAVGVGSWTRRQLLVADQDGVVQAWIRVHDRARGRTGVELEVAAEPRRSDGVDRDGLAAALLAWGAETAKPLARMRGVDRTQLDATSFADDERLKGWLADAGYECVRTWLQMSRPVRAEEAEPGVLPGPRAGVSIRPVAAYDDGLPVAEDLQTVHQLLEESFADHFNSYRESFPEFVQRLREDPGHRWDHWWIAEIDTGAGTAPGGALVGSVLVPNEQGLEGSYVDYIGVHRRARGRGVAKALLNTVITDAARRGRDRVGLEVDADSPTGADGLYRSLGWETGYRTESWHRSIEVS